MLVHYSQYVPRSECGGKKSPISQKKNEINVSMRWIANSECQTKLRLGPDMKGKVFAYQLMIACECSKYYMSRTEKSKQVRATIAHLRAIINL